MVVMAPFFSSAVASAWGKRDMPTRKRLEAPGLGTLVTDFIQVKVDAGDGTVLLKCPCQRLRQTGHANARMSGSTGPWHPPHRFHCAQG